MEQAKRAQNGKHKEDCAGGTHHIIKWNPHASINQSHNYGAPEKPSAMLRKLRVPPITLNGVEVVHSKADVEECSNGPHLDEEALCLAQGITACRVFHIKFLEDKKRACLKLEKIDA